MIVAPAGRARSLDDHPLLTGRVDPFRRALLDTFAAPTLPTRADVEREAAARDALAHAAERAAERADFARWLPAVTPGFDWSWRHLVYYRQKLEALGTSRRWLIVQIPVRHGKSELGTIRFPAWLLERDPSTRVLVGCHTAGLAQKFSRRTRRIVSGRGVALSEDRNTAADWETAQGGGLRALGVGGAAAGEGAHVGLIDDPFPNRKAAESRTYRDLVWAWFLDDFVTRLEPDAPLVVTMSRWHPDDLVGRLLSSEFRDRFDVIDLPALALTTRDEYGADGKIAEVPAVDPLGREEGEALEPRRFDRATLLDRKRILGHGFDALYQQRPRLRTGGLFEWDWFAIVDAAPRFARARVRYWDVAGTEVRGEDHDPDYTVGALCADTGKQFVFEDVARGQWGVGKRDAMIEQVARADEAKYGPGAVTQWIEADTGIGGHDRTQALVRRLAGLTVKIERPVTNKAARAEPLASQAALGNVAFVRAPWNTAVLSVLTSFRPGSDSGHDDDVDACAGAFNKVAAEIDSGEWTTVPVAR